ncbi:MAG TPA: GNAT family N-acetyltransferase [Candidatus Thermoplasmatota archaeon]|nr:GNAT family N-acetyltransferase [Candidatus Thermoplasmatota archaeon]
MTGLGAAPVLHTPRLTLRPLDVEDVPAVLAYAGEPGFFRFVSDAPAEVREHYGPHHAEAHVAELLDLAARGFPNWGIVPRGASQPAGALRFKPAAEDGAPELGYGLAAAWRGQGLAKEAAAAVVAWAAPRSALVARCDPRNLASLAVLRHAGFRPNGSDAAGRLLFKADGRGWGAPASRRVGPNLNLATASTRLP